MVKQSHKPLVLLLGNYRPSLILARTFKAREFNVVVGTHGCERLCQYSNAVDAMWSHSPLDNGPSALAEDLKELAGDQPGLTAIIPVAEEYVRVFAEHEDLFSELPPIVSMNSSLVNNCLDKKFMLNLARSTGVPTAPFAYTTGLSSAPEFASNTARYPLILRPKDSTMRINGNKAISVECPEQLAMCFKDHDLEKRELLVQQKFAGKRHNIYFAAIDGQITRLLHAVIERTDKVDGSGLAVEGRTLDANHEVAEQTKKLIDALNYTGIGCAQFLVDEKTGNSCFLEINPRIAGNHALPEAMGLDLGWFNFDRVVHQHSDRKIKFSNNEVRYCWTTGDLMGAKVAYLRGEIGLKSLVSWFAKALVSLIRSDLHMVFSLHDPYPAIRGLWKVVPRLARWRGPLPAHPTDTILTNEQRRPT